MMGMMLGQAVAYGLENTLYISCNHLLLQPKYSYGRAMLHWLPTSICLILAGCLPKSLGWMAPIWMILYILSYGINLHRNYQDSRKWKIVSVLCFIINLCVSQYLCKRISNHSGPFLINLERVLIYLIVFLGILYFSRRLRYHETISGLAGIAILPLGQILMIIYTRETLLKNGQPLPALGIISQLLPTVISVYWMYWVMGKNRWNQIRRELAVNRQNLAIEKEHYLEVERKREELRRICRDYTDQLGVLKELIHDRKAGAAEEQVGQLAQAVLSTRETPYCDIPVINAVLTEKERLCLEKGIGLDVNLNIPEILVDKLDLCSIFANLMDNAIRGVEEAERQNALPEKDKYIELAASERNGYLVVRCENPSVEPPAKPRKNHGRGIKIMQSIAEQYDGSYVREYHDGRYTAGVTLRLQDG